MSQFDLAIRGLSADLDARQIVELAELRDESYNGVRAVYSAESDSSSVNNGE